MPDQFKRYHLTLTRNRKTFRTTISLDKYLADLLAVSLDERPDTPAAHTAARAWLDKSLSEWPAFDPELPVSRQAALLALRRVANPSLLAKLDKLEDG